MESQIRRCDGQNVCVFPIFPCGSSNPQWDCIAPGDLKRLLQEGSDRDWEYLDWSASRVTRARLMSSCPWFSVVSGEAGSWWGRVPVFLRWSSREAGFTCLWWIQGMISATLTAVGVDKTTKGPLQWGFMVEHFNHKGLYGCYQANRVSLLPSHWFFERVNQGSVSVVSGWGHLFC
jgi:hypothetical protein